MTTSDSITWDEFRNGEKKALSHIYDKYSDLLYSYGMRFVCNHEIVKDTIQDLFFDLIRNRQNLGSTDNIYFYLLCSFRRKIVANLKNNNIKWIDLQESFNSNITYSVEDDFIKMEALGYRNKMVRDFLRRLSPKQREILFYRYNCNFDYDQICDLMSLKYDSARKLVFRSLQSLKKSMVNKDAFKLLFLLFRQTKF